MRELDRFEMRDERALVRWLARIAQGKLKDAYERETAKKRDQRRDVGMEDAVGGNVSAGSADVLMRMVAEEETSAVEEALLPSWTRSTGS